MLRDAGVSLVVGDIPPLAMRRRSAPTCPRSRWAISRGTGSTPATRTRCRWRPACSNTIRGAYRQASLALRLPMFGGFEVFGPRVRDVPFIARRSRMRSRRRTARLRHPRRPGGGAAVFRRLRHRVARSIPPRGHVGLPVPRHRRSSGAETGTGDVFGRSDENVACPVSANVITIDEQALYQQGLRYEDLVAASDVVVTKPGYGIISECIANGAAVLYTSRGHFIEYRRPRRRDAAISPLPFHRTR